MDPDDLYWDDLGYDPYEIIPNVQPAHLVSASSASLSDNSNKDGKFKAVLESPAPDCHLSSQNNEYKGQRGCGRGNSWRKTNENIYDVQPAHSVSASSASLSDDPDEDRKLRALLETPAIDYHRISQDNRYKGCRGNGRGKGGRKTNGNLWDSNMSEELTLPPGYICHRCNRPDHFIFHCPTNGDPSYDHKRPRNPTGIPKSMLNVTTDGSYTLPSGDKAILQPDEASFERAIEGIPTLARAIEVRTDHLPEYLHCSICSKIMKDAVMTRKCCHLSYCDKCIRDYILAKSECVCGAGNVLIDDLIPNKALRGVIFELLDSSSTSSQDTASSVVSKKRKI